MPKRLEQRLQREARRKGFSGKRYKAYVYGTLARIKSRQKRRRKGKR